MERPNRVSRLIAKRDELVKYRSRLEADTRALTCDIDHLEAAIGIFDQEDTPDARMSYAALRRVPKGQSMRFVPEKLREASGPLTSRQLADLWCEDRGPAAKPSTVSMPRMRIGTTLKTLHNKGLVEQSWHVEGWIGWTFCP